MTISEMNSIRDELGLTYQELCRESGVPIGTIQKVLTGTTRNPRVRTMRQLEETLSDLKHRHDMQLLNRSMGIAGERTADTDAEIKSGERSTAPSYAYRTRDEHQGMVCESAPVYGTAARSGSYLITASVRETLPDDRRTELIDGVLYDMASPTVPHQLISRMVTRQLEDCIHEHGSDGIVLDAPMDVCLDRDEYTVVQPDVFIVCDRKQITKKNIQGAPAFILEILSPSTLERDKVTKLFKYIRAGVREYWLIDPDARQVIVFDMTVQAMNTPEKEGQTSMNDPYKVSIYGFADRIPLAVSEGKCAIDMKPVSEMLDRLYA